MPGFFAFLSAVCVSFSISYATSSGPDDDFYFALFAMFATMCFCGFIYSIADKIILAIKQAHAPQQEQKPVAGQKS